MDCSKIGSVFHHAICIDCNQCLAVTRRGTRVRAIKLLERDSTTIQSVGETRRDYILQRHRTTRVTVIARPRPAHERDGHHLYDVTHRLGRVRPSVRLFLLSEREARAHGAPANEPDARDDPGFVLAHLLAISCHHDL